MQTKKFKPLRSFTLVPIMLLVRPCYILRPTRNSCTRIHMCAYVQHLLLLLLFFQFLGCGELYIADGNWKLKYAHCMWEVPVVVDGFDRPINYPSVCPLSPQRGKAFCKQHCDDACKGGLPTGLEEFLRFCGLRNNNNSGSCTLP